MTASPPRHDCSASHSAEPRQRTPLAGFFICLAPCTQRAQDTGRRLSPVAVAPVRARVNTGPGPVSAPRWRGFHLSCPLHSAGAGWARRRLQGRQLLLQRPCPAGKLAGFFRGPIHKQVLRKTENLPSMVLNNTAGRFR
jgi:hypothetical protein